MEDGELIEQAVAYVAGLLGRTAGKAADKLGGAVADKLVGLLRRHAKTSEALDDLGDAPDDADLRAGVRVQLRKALRGDDALRAELTALMREVAQDSGGVTQTATVAGNENIVIQAGRDVKR